MLAPDETVSVTGIKAPDPSKSNGESAPAPDQQDTGVVDMQQHTLYLCKDKSRKITVSGPIEITRAEYGRICKWLEVSMMVEDEPAQKSAQ
jgi:hypothetical protein